jgi:hypothetical protein
VIPPRQNADFVAHMEDVLDLYCRPYDPDYPVVNMDEQPIQLVKETRRPLAASPGQTERFDYEYERGGVANAFMFVEALAGWRNIDVRERKTASDWAAEIKALLNGRYANAKKVILICDNLNTHKIAALYEVFEPEEARALARRLEIHPTPKHGSWLNIAECELSAFTRQCLTGRRVPDMATLVETVCLWQTDRNARQKGVAWRFTTDDARIKLSQLYPEIKMS